LNILMTEGRFSVARAHLLVGMYLIVLGLPPSRWFGSPTFFFSSMIIVAVGAVSLLLEARLIRLPARARAWAISDGRSRGFAAAERVTEDGADNAGAARARDTDRARLVRWSLLGDRGQPDLAVIQLVGGIGIVPMLGAVQPFAAVGWRLVAITALSEIVYLSFLGARLIKVAELTDVVRQMRATRLQRKYQEKELAELKPARTKEAIADRKSLQTSIAGFDSVQAALEARAEALWRQLGFIYGSESADRTGGKRQGAPRLA